MAIEKELLDQLLAGRDPNEVFAKDGLLDDLKKALSERILNAELDEHLDGESGLRANRRNGYSKKSVLTGTSKMTLSIPREWFESKTQFAIRRPMTKNGLAHEIPDSPVAIPHATVDWIKTSLERANADNTALLT
jgi:hypothetical protein